MCTATHFTINWEKSHLTPTRCLKYLGVVVHSDAMEFVLPREKVEKLQRQCQQLLLAPFVTVREVASLVGSMVSTAVAILPAPLHYRTLQSLKSSHIRQGRSYNYHVTLTQECRDELHWWVNHLHRYNGRAVRIAAPDLVIQSDASSAGRAGWGACCEKTTTGGRWTAVEKSFHINILELLAAKYALQSLVPSFRKGVILLQLDEVAVACLKRMGSNRSPMLNAIAAEIWEWCLDRAVTLQAEYLPGVANSVADFHSRNHTDGSDWMLDASVFHHLQRLWPCQCDLFASRTNAQLESYVSWHPDPCAWHTNAFTLDWSELSGYAFPPSLLDWQVFVQDYPTSHSVHSDGDTALARSTVVPSLVAMHSGHSTSPPIAPTSSNRPRRGEPSAHVNGLPNSGRVEAVRTQLSGQGVSAMAADLLLASWRAGAEKTY